MKRLFKKYEDDSHNFWMSYTDLMAGFLIVFIVASLLYYHKNNQIQEMCNGIPLEEIAEFVNGRQNGTLVDMSKDFEDVFKDVDSIKVLPECIRIYPYYAKELFKSTSDSMEQNLQIRIKQFGHKFVTRALELVQAGKDIQEIRIEGHTDSDKDFIYNLDLSSRRAHTVYTYIHDHCGLNPEEIEFMEDRMIAVGYSEARLIGNHGMLVGKNKEAENKDKSRRIEFRIIGKDKY